VADRNSPTPTPVDHLAEAITTFTKVAKIGLAISIVLSVTLLGFSLLAAVSVKSAACAGRQQILGHEIGFGDSVGVAIFCLIMLWMVGKMASAKDDRLRRLFSTFDDPHTKQINPGFGAGVAYGTLGMAVLILGVTTISMVMRDFYPAIARCLPS
jgi:hypothetical protein